MRRKNRYEGLDALVGERGSALLGTAVLLAGSRAAGEDCYRRRWSAWCVTGPGSGATRKGYLRRTMYHLAVDQWRSRGRRPEVLAAVEPPGQPDGTGALHLRQALVQALATLPPLQRAVLVLRYWEQLSAAEAAEVLEEQLTKGYR